MHDLLTGLLERARQRAATEADAYLVDEQHSSVQVRLGKVETVTHSREQRLALRVFSGKASASASTSDLSRESVERLVDEAVALARLTAPDPVAGLPDPGEFAPAIPDLGLEDPEGHGLTPEEKIAIAQRAETAALEVDPRITNSEGAEFFERRARYAYATSHGFFGSYPTSSFGLTVSPVASANGEMQRDSWYTFARKRARLEAPEVVGRIAAQRALRRLGARQIKTAQVPVIFDPETAASLLRALAGAASGPGLYRGASFLLNRLGTRIAALGVTIVDSGIIPGALGSRPFDGEGLPIRKTVLVNAGTLES
ncbi:MAG: TldD/PmbA family protein, partial [Candidatus Rokubacteria bacterium]|nr:TldD/PmbA family protein [Candidatus Rokubacteria bacterium]